MSVIVWSKDNCAFCVRVKKLLESKSIAYEERNLSTGGWTREQLLEAVPTARTLPQVFIDDKHIGGYTETQEFLQ